VEFKLTACFQVYLVNGRREIIKPFNRRTRSISPNKTPGHFDNDRDSRHLLIPGWTLRKPYQVRSISAYFKIPAKVMEKWLPAGQMYL